MLKESVNSTVCLKLFLHYDSIQCTFITTSNIPFTLTNVSFDPNVTFISVHVPMKSICFAGNNEWHDCPSKKDFLKKDFKDDFSQFQILPLQLQPRHSITHSVPYPSSSSSSSSIVTDISSSTTSDEYYLQQSLRKSSVMTDNGSYLWNKNKNKKQKFMIYLHWQWT